MADLKPFQSQVASDAVSLPQTSVYSRFAQAAGVAQQELANIGATLATESALKQGAKDRLEGGKRELIPGLNKPTQAYAKAFLEMDNSILYANATKQLDEKLMSATRPGSLNSETPVQYQDVSKAIVDGFVGQAMDENKPELALKLSQYAANNQLKAMHAANNYADKQLQGQFNSNVLQFSDSIYQQARDGNQSLARETYDEAIRSLDSQIQFGFITPEQKFNIEKSLTQQGLNGTAESEYLKWAATKPQGGEKYISHFYKTNEEGMTPEQKDGILQHLLTVHKNKLSADTQINNYGAAKIQEDMVTPGAINSIEDLNQRMDSLKAEGYPVNDLQQIQLRSAFKKAQLKGLKAAEKEVALSRAIANQSNDIFNFSSGDIDDFFIKTIEFQKAERDKAVAEAKTDAEKEKLNVPDWLIEAITAGSIGRPVNNYTERLSKTINYGSLDQQVDAIKAFNFLNKNNPIALDGLTAEEKAFFTTADIRTRNSRLDPALIIDETKKTIFQSTDEDQKRARHNLTEMYRKKPNFINNLAKDVYGKKLTNTGADPLFNILKTEFDQNYLITNDEGIAKELTKRNMERVTLPESEFGIKGVPAFNPPEKLPFYNVGNIVRNQFAEALENVVFQSTQFPEALPYDIKASTKMPAMPEKISDEDRFAKDFYPNGGWLNIDGKDKKIAFVSPNFKDAALFPGTTYQILYEDTPGNWRQLNSLNTTLNPITGEEKLVLGPAMVNVKSPDKYIPNMLAVLQQKASDAQETQAIETRFNALNPNEIVPMGHPMMADSYTDPRPASQRMPEEFKAFLGENKGKVKERVTQEKTRREMAKLDGAK